jgi:cohesin complex subunit SA-1/2
MIAAELFATGKSPDTIATGWISHITTDQHEALAELFTFLLRCAGCEEKVEGQMLEDPDTYPDQLSHIQDSYQAVRLSHLFGSTNKTRNTLPIIR